MKTDREIKRSEIVPESEGEEINEELLFHLEVNAIDKIAGWFAFFDLVNIYSRFVQY